MKVQVYSQIAMLYFQNWLKYHSIHNFCLNISRLYNYTTKGKNALGLNWKIWENNSNKKSISVSGLEGYTHSSIYSITIQF